jgi:hypothetical protein
LTGGADERPTSEHASIGLAVRSRLWRAASRPAFTEAGETTQNTLKFEMKP